MEKRKTPRVPISMVVTYETGNDFVSSYLFDVSGGGVFIGTDAPLDVGSKVRICFNVPEISDSIAATGTVVWNQDPGSSRPGMGIRFDDMDLGDRKRLNKFLLEHKEG